MAGFMLLWYIPRKTHPKSDNQQDGQGMTKSLSTHDGNESGHDDKDKENVGVRGRCEECRIVCAAIDMSVSSLRD